MKINWKVRFNKQNITFVIRFFLALLVPILVYMGLELTDLTSWESLGVVLLSAVSNPYLVGLTIINALNMIPDPTTVGVSDSNQALTYEIPNKNGCRNYHDGQEGTESIWNKEK